MDIQEKLMSRNGLATVKVAKQLLNVSIGERIPTVVELSQSNNMAVGTTFNALKALMNDKAIEGKAHGHLGTFLVNKNMNLLLSYAGITHFVGVMPLPYTKRYEGLASGLISQLENKYDIPVNLAYMRGANMRIMMTLQGRYDFAIVSKFAADEYMKNNDDIIQMLSFGENSYTSNHVVMFNDPNATEIKDGMRIGIDSSSIDQKVLTERVCAGKKVEFIEAEYSHVIEHVINGDVDATVMNVDEALEKNYKINCRKSVGCSDSTIAVMVAAKDNNEIAKMIKDIIDVNAVVDIQRKVMEGKIQPSY